MRLPDLPDSLTSEGIRRQRWTLFAVCAVTLLVAALVPLAALVSDGRIGVSELMTDPAEQTGIPWYLGAVNALNLLIWGAAAAVQLVAVAGLRRRTPRLATALAWLGCLTVLLTLDDRFLLHEIFFPWIFGVPQTVTFAVYILLLALVLARYGRVLLEQPEASALLIAVAAFAGSVGLDVVGWDAPARRAAEETLKLLGTVAWLAFPPGS